MNPKSLIPLLVIAVAIGFGYGLATFFHKAPSTTTAETSATNAAEPEAPTTFVCVQEGGQWKTFAESGSPNSNAVIRSKNPLFTWNSEEFGDSWTPEKRCREVTQRFNDAVANNGGKLANLNLKTGQVNDETVACAVQSQSEFCNQQNILFTMSQHNEADPQQTLAKLINFSQQGKPINENAPPSHISLKSLVNLGAIEPQKTW
jgi:hypothetical protein